MKTDDENQKTAIEPIELDPNVVYPIKITAEIVNAPQHIILVYCRHGIISPVGDPETEGYFFDAKTIHLLRRLEYLRNESEINMTGIRHIVELANEVKRLRAEIRFLRG
jgi:DNA-binding transcriptional MerR regulator